MMLHGVTKLINVLLSMTGTVNVCVFMRLSKLVLIGALLTSAYFMLMIFSVTVFALVSIFQSDGSIE